MSDFDQKSAWLVRVLGVDVSGGTRPGGDQARLLPVWIDAKEEIDAGIGQLQRVLGKSDRPGLRLIAEYGLNGLTQRESVGMMVALRNFDADPAAEPARKKLASAAQAFRTVLGTHPIMPLLENNPFGVALPVRATLGKALDAIEARLSG
jgi:hypothetical protein